MLQERVGVYGAAMLHKSLFIWVNDSSVSISDNYSYVEGKFY